MVYHPLKGKDEQKRSILEFPIKESAQRWLFLFAFVCVLLGPSLYIKRKSSLKRGCFGRRYESSWLLDGQISQKRLAVRPQQRGQAAAVRAAMIEVLNASFRIHPNFIDMQVSLGENPLKSDIFAHGNASFLFDSSRVLLKHIWEIWFFFLFYQKRNPIANGNLHKFFRQISPRASRGCALLNA